MSGLGTLPDPADLRDRMELREKTALDTDCVHPAEALRYDGNWDLTPEPRAQVTCSLCGHSPTIPISERELRRMNGGSRQHGGGTDSVASIPHDRREATP